MEKLRRALWIYGGALLDCLRYGVGRVAYHVRKRREQRQYCKRCGCTTNVVWKLRDDTWNRVVRGRYKVLCFECLLELVHEENVKLTTSDFVLLERPFEKYIGGDRA